MSFTITDTINRVLVADDDPVVRHLVSTVIRQHGFTPVVVNDGREAWRMLQADSNFRAALLDMSMPFLKGIDLIRHMRTEKRLLRIPVMVITGEPDIKLLADCFAAGATAFLPKPFTAAQLKNALRMLIGERSQVTKAA